MLQPKARSFHMIGTTKGRRIAETLKQQIKGTIDSQKSEIKPVRTTGIK